ncbi:hypothetical protein AB6A40_008137 [Gnathostoma spinigerum]|uniref:Cystatin domain-containing protein n=1 Tax=Gnathostoma spinigerum TaxID=75299 RepID=A0ABD6EN92_9BILA
MLSIPLVLFCLLVTVEMETTKIAIDTGGWTIQSPNDPHVVKLAQGSVEDFNKRATSEYYFAYSDSYAAASRVTFGLEWELEVEYQITDCKKNEDWDSKKCTPKEEGETRTAVLNAVEIPGEDKVVYQF